MKLLFQSDDYGFTEAVTEGILKSIKDGIVRNTGLFVNMPSSLMAAEKIKNIPHISVGIDVNIVAGTPVTKDVSLISSLVNEKGEFRTSGERVAQVKETGEDPYVYEEVLLETRNQVQLFIELMGRKPAYIHPHSFMSANYMKAMSEVAKEQGVYFSMELLQAGKFHMLDCDWNPKPFPIEKQAVTDVEGNLLRELSKVLDKEIVFAGGHCGYVDDELLKFSTYSLIRCKDLSAATSPKIKKFIEDNSVELISYDDLKGIGI